MGCRNEPELRESRGVCHCCAQRDRLPAVLQVFVGSRGRDHQSIRFCGQCCHWFCEHCRRNVMGRSAGFFEELVRGAPDGCCGPAQEEVA